MPRGSADTIRILVATDSHVGYNERDAIRGDDSWKTFHEIMCLAKDRDVDMVLLAGDLFHDNQPSRKALHKVMQSLRLNCYGEKPCELEMLSDPSENFQGTFNHVNYEDPDINVAIPVFSINGNHDDPSGAGHLAALDILQISGLLNYYGQIPESDNISVKPVLLQKGRTKLALYGMSNVRDERLYRTFRDGKVKFFQPGTQKGDWFNLMSVHQNRHAYTETGYLPENFLPGFMDLVVWGHEHECLIEPRQNAETNFHVLQPGSSIATSLMPGEAVPKHVAIVSITGHEFESEPIRLKTVRPFVMHEIVLSEHQEAKKLAKKDNNRTELTRLLIEIVDGLIEQARKEWLEVQDEAAGSDDVDVPLPLIRLRAEYSAPDGGSFDCENPQRFSNRFVGKVANVNDVVQFHRKKKGATRMAQNGAELPEASVMAQLSIDSVKVDKLVREFLSAQSLTILPQNSFGDAVSQYIEKDDKHAMEMFVTESLSAQVKHLIDLDAYDDLSNEMSNVKSKLEELFDAGHLRTTRKARLKPKPDNWDTDLDGAWGDQPGALLHSDIEDHEDDDESIAAAPTNSRKPAAATSKRAPKKAAPRKAAAATATPKRRPVVESMDDDVVVIDSEGGQEPVDSDEEEIFIRHPAPPTRKTASTAKPAPKPTSKSTSKTLSVASTRKAPARAPRNAQSKLNFSQISQKPSSRGPSIRDEISDANDDDDDEDAFEPAQSSLRSDRTRR